MVPPQPSTRHARRRAGLLVAAIIAGLFGQLGGAEAGPVLFSDGFESGNLSAWSTVQTGADGSATVQSAVVKTGTYAARFSATTTAGSFAYARRSFASAQTDVAAAGDFQVQSEGASGGNVPIFRLLDAAGTKLVSLYRQNGAGGIWVWYNNTYNATSATLALNTWAQLEVHVVATGSATGTVDVSVNGAIVYHSATATLPAAGVNTAQIGNSSAAQAFTIVADNIVLSSGATSTAPTNTSPPTISGSAVVNQTLSASPGTWSGTAPITYSYQWRRCDNTGVNCADVPGATGATYVLTPSEVNFTMRVAVTGTNTVSSSTAVSAATAVVTAGAQAPANTVPPSITGTPRQGQTLTANPGTWSGTQPITFAYQWRRCDSAGKNCVDISGATAATFVLTAADVGHGMKVFVTASNIGGTAGTPAPPTAAVTASDPVIAAVGDIACDPHDPYFNGGLGSSTYCHQKHTSDLVVNGGFTAVLPLGDEQYDCAPSTAFATAYDPTWGRVKSISRPAPGNHEYKSTNPDLYGYNLCKPNAQGYYGYFGASAGDPTKGYYSYDLGSWHMIVLNTTRACSVISCAAGSAQEQWLKADLAAHPAACTLAYWHEPRFSSKTPSTKTDAFWKDLYAAGADVVLAGHVHNYERFAPQNPSAVADPARGIREFVVGMGGRSHESSGTTIAANSEARNSTVFGILKLTLHASTYDWQFIPQAGQSYSDTGTGACH
jgi:acid phosphatase type 7